MVDNPMKKTLLALGFLKGDVVDDWVDVQHNWINQKRAPTDPNTNHVQVPSTDPIFWTHFITEFNQAFADSAEKQNASTELHRIRMQGVDLDSYVARFKTLAAKAGYGLDEEGTLNLFRRGLPDALGKNVITKHNPQSWNEWDTMTRAEHDVWLKLSSLYPKKQEKMKFGKTESEWCRSFKPKGQPHGKGSGGAVPMVVDPPGWINRTLTEEEKTTMLKEGRCFRCSNKGHMSKACPTRPSSSSTSSTSKSKHQHARTTKVEEVEEEDDEEPETKLGVDHIINSIHAMTMEEREDFLTKAFAQKDF